MVTAVEQPASTSTATQTPSPEPRATGSVPTAQIAECRCPDVCERDHDND